MLEFDHLKLEDFAMVEREILTKTGEYQKVRVLDRGKLFTLQRQRAKDGRRIMEPFRLWLIEYEGHTAIDAHKLCATIFTAMWETQKKPWETFCREDIADPQLCVLARGLKLLTHWMLNVRKDLSLEERDWAHECLEFLTHRQMSKYGRKGRRKVKVKQRKDITEDGMDLVNPDDWPRIMQAIEEWHKERGVRFPWARPILRIRIICGLNIRGARTLYYLSRKDAVKALAHRPKAGAALRLAKKDASNLVRVLPVQLFREELETLVNFPAPWGILADLVSRAPTVDGRVASAEMIIARLWREIVFDYGPKADLYVAEQDWKRFNAIAARRLALCAAYDAMPSLTMLQAMFAISSTSLRSDPYLSAYLERKHLEEKRKAGNTPEATKEAVAKIKQVW